MPQIGWFEILIIVVLALVIIGPKDLPIVLKKIGKWIGTCKDYFRDVQDDITEIESSIKKEVSLDKEFINNDINKKKNE
jgi:sec-independent protein translocase protein TatB